VQADLQAESVAISPESRSQLRSVALTIHQMSALVPGKVDWVGFEVSESRRKSEPIYARPTEGINMSSQSLTCSERNESLHECYQPREAGALMGYC
jgi:hypothetical protein